MKPQKQNADGSSSYWKCEIKSFESQGSTMMHNEDYTIIKHAGVHHNLCASKPKVHNTLADLRAPAVASQKSFLLLTVTSCEKNNVNETASSKNVSLQSPGIDLIRRCPVNTNSLIQINTTFLIVVNFSCSLIVVKLM